MLSAACLSQQNNFHMQQVQMHRPLPIMALNRLWALGVTELKTGV